MESGKKWRLKRKWRPKKDGRTQRDGNSKKVEVHKVQLEAIKCWEVKSRSVRKSGD